MDIQEIRKYLPHRYPFLLIDRVLSYELGKHIVAQKNVTINEPFFQGHFPHFPVMPGVMIIEALAQAAAILSMRTLEQEIDAGSLFFFAGIDAARFKKPVMPGDVLTLYAELTRYVRNIGKFTARAEVDGKVVAEAELMCALRPIAEQKGEA